MICALDCRRVKGTTAFPLNLEKAITYGAISKKSNMKME